MKQSPRLSHILGNAYKECAKRKSPLGKEPSSSESPDPADPDSSSRLAGTKGVRYQEKHRHIMGRGLISSSALGLTDGLVSNLAFLTGFAGAETGTEIIRFAGLAAMLAGTVSIFFGGVLAARSELDLYQSDARREAYEIEHEREEEVLELRELYREKGLSEDEAARVVDTISQSREKFLEDMLTNELHIHKSDLENPFKLGGVTGLSFLIGAFVPLAPYYLLSVRTNALVLSLTLSLAFLFAAGVWKGHVVEKAQWKSGLETLLIGAAAAGLLFLIGTALGFV